MQKEKDVEYNKHHKSAWLREAWRRPIHLDRFKNIPADLQDFEIRLSCLLKRQQIQVQPKCRRMTEKEERIEWRREKSSIEGGDVDADFISSSVRKGKRLRNKDI